MVDFYDPTFNNRFNLFYSDFLWYRGITVKRYADSEQGALKSHCYRHKLYSYFNCLVHICNKFKWCHQINLSQNLLTSLLQVSWRIVFIPSLFGKLSLCDCWLSSDSKFLFIAINNPDDLKDHDTKRRARSHAVKQALENNRKLRKESGDNFRVSSSKDYSRRLASNRIRSQPRVTIPLSPSVSTLDPFQTLDVDSSRLHALFSNCKQFIATEKLPWIDSLHKLIQTRPDRLPSLFSVLRMSLYIIAFTQFSTQG